MRYIYLLIGVFIITVFDVDFLIGWPMAIGYIMILIGLRHYTTYNVHFSRSFMAGMFLAAVAFMLTTFFQSETWATGNIYRLSDPEANAVFFVNIVVVVVLFAEFVMVSHFCRGVTFEAKRSINQNVSLNLYARLVAIAFLVRIVLHTLDAFGIFTFAIYPYIVSLIDVAAYGLFIMLLLPIRDGFKRIPKDNEYSVNNML